MKQVRFLHFADLHLDAPFTSMGAADKSRMRRQELKACFKRIISEASNEKVDFILISGDLYEHEYTDKKTILYAADEFTSIPDIKIIIIPGNHDPYTGNSYYKNFQWPDNVYILAGERSHLAFEEIKTCIYTQACIPEIQAELKNGSHSIYKDGYFNILMLHGTLNMGFSKNTWNPLESSVLEQTGMDYIALGHFHSRLEAGGAQGKIYNPGSPEPLGFDEEGSHGIFSGVLFEDNFGGRTRDIMYMPINQRNYIKINVNVDGCGTDERIINEVTATIRAAGRIEDLYEVRLKGYTDESLVPDEAYIAESVSREAFCVRVINESMPGYDFEAIAMEPGLRGVFTRKLLDRIEAAASEKDRLLAERALIMGLEAMDGGVSAN